MTKIAMPSMPSLDQPPPLLRECGQTPSAARFGGSKGLSCRVPLSGVHPNKSTTSKLGKGTNGKVVQPSGKNLALLCHPEIYLDPSCPTLCAHCKLPLGDHCYTEEEKGRVHGECMAQLLVQQLRGCEDKRNHEDEEEKLERRREFDIGWKHVSIPRNIEMQSKLNDTAPLDGMCCLVLDEDSQSVRLATTSEPLAAINLEYLSIALQVRRKEGGEPLFSLDAVQPRDILKEGALKDSSQIKRFEPEWLAGTSVGEVLFQADYHLKELSMGEFEQPVVGMKSCFDYYHEEDESNKNWKGREWFMVRKAEVLLSDDSVIIPTVKMGVEAREQLYCDGEMVDAPITRKSHPMVKYADAFTKNFDLIAERKSVIFHLRELAKASVMAKYLVESCIQMEESWFSLAAEAQEACALEIPQLWNERVHSKIRVKNGELVDSDYPLVSNHGIYGGVQFGLDKFKLARPAGLSAVLPSGLAAGVSAGRIPQITPVGRIAQLQLTKPAAPISQFQGARPAGQVFAGPPGLAAVSVPRLVPGIPQISLDKYSLARPSLLLPPRPAPALGDFEVPVKLPRALLDRFRVAQQISPGIPEETIRAATQIGTITPAMPFARVPEPVPRAAARQRGLLAGGVLARQPIPPSVSQAPIAPPTRLSVQPEPTALSIAMPGAAVARQAITMPAAFSVAMPGAGVGTGGPQGVDLNLNQFSLDAVEQRAEGKWICEPESENTATALADAFWTCIDSSKVPEAEKDDFALFKNVFNPNLSDRRAEGECFTTPDTNAAYINKLQSLVKEEEEIRQQRKDHFFSAAFQYDNPGLLFPISWAPSLAVAGAKTSEHVLSEGASLQPRSNFKDAAGEILKSALPAFHKKTEEGLSFRIYRVGNLEVRTTQEYDGEEIVGAFFSVHAKADSPAKLGAARCAGGRERIGKVTEYVYKAQPNSNDFHYYVVLETESGITVLSEQLGDGAVTWEENLVDLDIRTGLAKVIRFGDCHMGTTVQDMKMHRDQVLQDCQHQLTKQGYPGQAYATSAYTIAVGGLDVAMRIADNI